MRPSSKKITAKAAALLICVELWAPQSALAQRKLIHPPVRMRVDVTSNSTSPGDLQNVTARYRFEFQNTSQAAQKFALILEKGTDWNAGGGGVHTLSNSVRLPSSSGWYSLDSSSGNEPFISIALDLDCDKTAQATGSVTLKCKIMGGPMDDSGTPPSVQILAPTSFTLTTPITRASFGFTVVPTILIEEDRGSIAATVGAIASVSPAGPSGYSSTIQGMGSHSLNGGRSF